MKQLVKPSLSMAVVLPVLLVWACENPTKQQVYSSMRADFAPPTAKILTDTLSIHGHTRLDDYFWLRDRENPEVISYLEAENDYLENVMAPLKDFRKSLFQEMKARIQEDDSSVPYKLDNYYYYTRFEKGGEYAIHCRRKGSMEAPEEVIANGNELANGTSFYNFFLQTSPNHQLTAIIADTVGRRVYNIAFKDLTTGQLLLDVISTTTNELVWANDNKTVFYARQDPQTLRSYQIYQHILGTPASQDKLIFEEKDETFGSYLDKTKSKKFITILSYSTLSTEYHVINADNPEEGLKLVQKREKDLLYFVNHYGDKFYINTNLNAKNFKLVETPTVTPGKEHWKDVIPHRPEVLLEDFDIFRNFLVVNERKQGLTTIRMIGWNDGQEHELQFDEPAYTARLGTNPDFNTELLRYEYNSLTTPKSFYDYHMVSREKTLLKRQPVLGDFNPQNYRSERVMVTAKDGVQIPVSIVYHKDTKLNGTAPCVIYGYGSYGFSLNPSFNSNRLSLLNRGFVYALAHIRGGQEMGRQWYEDGKLFKKKNTFTDFIACSEYLIDNGYAAEDQLFASGGSAGGLLVGAVSNMRPDLYKGIISAVPFVDVVTTMLDESIPLTTGEYDEWGNPNVKEYYDYMLSYSPYDNLEARDYPHMLVTTGLHDSQVQYWEPAKYVARLRAKKTNNNLVLLQTNMTAGHGGASGRFESLKTTALEYAFMLDLAGKSEKTPPVQ